MFLPPPKLAEGILDQKYHVNYIQTNLSKGAAIISKARFP